MGPPGKLWHFRKQLPRRNGGLRRADLFLLWKKMKGGSQLLLSQVCRRLSCNGSQNAEGFPAWQPESPRRIMMHISGYGGIGRRAGFRFQWETVQVQVLLSAVQKNPVFTRNGVFKGFLSFDRIQIFMQYSPFNKRYNVFRTSMQHEIKFCCFQQLFCLHLVPAVLFLIHHGFYEEIYVSQFYT